MTYDRTTTGDQIQAADTKGEGGTPETIDSNSSDAQDLIYSTHETVNPTLKVSNNLVCETSENTVADACNPILDDEIRSRLDKLNALSDLINSLERQFDDANSIFRDTLKCSTDRLSSIAKALGTKSIRHGRVYQTARVSVEQSQSECQIACVQFEQANKDHQHAKKAIKDAELKLKEAAEQTANGVTTTPNVNFDSIDFRKLNLRDGDSHAESNHPSCDRNAESSPNPSESGTTNITQHELVLEAIAPTEAQTPNENNNMPDEKASSTTAANNAAKLSEELNLAIMRLIEAERKRSQSERQHLDRANKLMIAQENLTKLEREHGPSIRRSQLYFDEAKRFDAKLNSVKGDICRISEEIVAAKQAYAQTLKELEEFSEYLHDNSASVVN